MLLCRQAIVGARNTEVKFGLCDYTCPFGQVLIAPFD
jgi:hypothetical protein